MKTHQEIQDILLKIFKTRADYYKIIEIKPLNEVGGGVNSRIVLATSDERVYVINIKEITRRSLK